MTGPRSMTADPSRLAELLRQALGEAGISAEVHGGRALALVSVRVGLVVCCDGEFFWWRTGWNVGRQRSDFARHPAIDPIQAARRVASRYAELRECPSDAIAQLVRAQVVER